MDTKTLLDKMHACLRAAFGERLKGVVLYGSTSRGDDRKGSDIDIIVLLTAPIALWRDLETIVDAIYPLQLEIDRSIHATPVDIDSYERGSFALYRNARREGIRL